ncbi:hypothetical protein [Bradyrhizobium jicamae]|uniref:hypothetical protein n=1 Tax=Bradyrhizobium jicamae TaxID=280332 RepID=UPI0012ECD2F1|nr:hypothetical protein [Bradyrhizobium jicamae]
MNAAALGRHVEGRSRIFARRDSLLGLRGGLSQSRFHRIGHIFGVTRGAALLIDQYLLHMWNAKARIRVSKVALEHEHPMFHILPQELA